MKDKRIMVLIAMLIVTSLACSAISNLGLDQIGVEVTPTERPLMSFDFEDVCRRGAMTDQPVYAPEPGSGRIHPVVIFYNYEPDSTYWSYAYPSQLNLPIPWIIELDGDFAPVEVVACAEMLEVEQVIECSGYEDEDTGETFTLLGHDSTFEVTVYAANTGEVLGSTIMKSEYGDCPMFSMFDDPVENRYASLPQRPMEDFLQPFVEP